MFNQSRQHTLVKAYCPIIFTVNHFRDTNQLIFWMKSNSDNNVGTRKKYIKNWTNSKWSIISSIKYIIFVKFSSNSDKYHFGKALSNVHYLFIFYAKKIKTEILIYNQIFLDHVSNAIYASFAKLHLILLSRSTEPGPKVVFPDFFSQKHFKTAM